MINASEDDKDSWQKTVAVAALTALVTTAATELAKWVVDEIKGKKEEDK